MNINFTFQMMLAVGVLFSVIATGFILLFAIVVMPGIGKLEDRAFLKAFQLTDSLIQNNQPLFMIVWLGSPLFMIGATFLGATQLYNVWRILLFIATAVNIFGVQLPTFIFNIPLNNRLQSLNLDKLSEASLSDERLQFEASWNRWNNFRTLFAFVTSSLLMTVLINT
ncbi:MAG: DUF1772 domain-containing protein [Chloroflexota bacterium]